MRAWLARVGRFLRHLWEGRPERWYRDVWLFAITVLVYLALAADEQQDRDDERQDAANAKLSYEIQAQRREFVWRACRNQNERHLKAEKVVDGRIRSLPPGEARQAAVAGRAFTFALIDAIAPIQDCVEVVAEGAPPLNGGDGPPAVPE